MLAKFFKMKFIFVVLLFNFSWGAKPVSDFTKEVNYYENLIKTGIEEAKNYNLPTDNEQYRPKNSRRVKDIGIWDFIVVGAGCGGAVVANRLSEIKHWNVLLLEAGGPETNFSVIPAMHLYLHSSRFNWGYYSTEQKHACLGMEGNRCAIVKGRVLGGSSSVNYACYARPNKDDFNRWALEGNLGWSYDEILPYFIKSENSQVNSDPGYHGRNGYWNVKYERPISDQFQNFIDGSRIVRNFSSTDYNGRDQLGVFQMQINNLDEFRDSSNNAFIKPIRNRKNLKIITNAYVTKVLLNRVTKNALGVVFAKGGKLYRAIAHNEVILSAGAINTPQILMLSGIGPKEHLRKMHIPVVANLPVGKTLHDHNLFYGAYIGTNFTEPPLTLREQVELFVNDAGPLTTYSSIETIGFYQTKLEKNPIYPDLEIVIGLTSALDRFLKHDLRLTDETYQAIINSLSYFQSTLNVLQFVLRSQSVGSVTLKSKDPYQHPNIDANLLAEKYDVEVLYQGLLLMQEIVKTDPLKGVNATLVVVDYPQCRNYTLGSKDYWVCVIRLMTASAYHHCGSCKMGPDPRTSVVNSRGMVHGFKNLRIVDASIFPTLVAGHIAAATVMMAERISDLIKIQYGLPIQPITNVIN